MQRVKYHRTPHLPWSPGATDDDIRLNTASNFAGRHVMVTEKRDGECTTLYQDGYIHARSIDGTGKPYQSWVANMWQAKRWEFPEQWRICGENLYARHSIAYDSLPSYFEAFSMWDQHNVSLHSMSCVTWCDLLGIQHVPILFDGVWDERLIRLLCEQTVTGGGEGLVVRLADPFHWDEFPVSVAKYVRANHVTTDAHWTHNWQPNTLAV